MEWNEDYIFILVIHEKTSDSPITTEIDCGKSLSKNTLIVEFRKEHEKGKKVRWEFFKMKEYC